MKYSLIPFASLLLLSSCAWYRNLERSLVEDEEKTKSSQSRSVPRAQYDQLLVKYEELSKKYEQLKEQPQGQSNLADEVQKTQGENFSASSSETVDVFQPSNNSTIDVPADIESQLTLYRRGLSLKSSNPGEATKIFQKLETEGVPAVKVRAKLQVGEMLLEKTHYDLALQVFEDIINKHASSGVVLDALKHAVVCSEKLGIANKKEQYSSMLNDIFGARGQGL